MKITFYTLYKNKTRDVKTEMLIRNTRVNFYVDVSSQQQPLHHC